MGGLDGPRRLAATDLDGSGAKDLDGPRAKDYGDAYENHERIAKMWSVLLDKDVSVPQVLQCMVAVKQDMPGAVLEKH